MYPIHFAAFVGCRDSISGHVAANGQLVEMKVQMGVEMEGERGSGKRGEQRGGACAAEWGCRDTERMPCLMVERWMKARWCVSINVF